MAYTGHIQICHQFGHQSVCRTAAGTYHGIARERIIHLLALASDTKIKITVGQYSV